jgi:hypothetical protein
MQMNKINWTSVGADYGLSRKKTDDESGPCPVTPPRSEGSVATGRKRLRGVDTERSACAQQDRAVTPPDVRIILFISMIVPSADLSASLDILMSTR